MPRYEIDFDDQQVGAAVNWHGGQGSMLYAVASTGALRLGTRRPRGVDNDREWFIYLANELEDEASKASQDASRQAWDTPDEDERTELREEAAILESIARDARDAAKAAENRQWPFESGLGRRRR